MRALSAGGSLACQPNCLFLLRASFLRECFSPSCSYGCVHNGIPAAAAAADGEALEYSPSKDPLNYVAVDSEGALYRSAYVNHEADDLARSIEHFPPGASEPGGREDGQEAALLAAIAEQNARMNTLKAQLEHLRAGEMSC